jgi:O-antigen ligase
MSLGLAFWILMLLWLVFGMWRSWPDHYIVGGNLLLFILLLLLGWKAFGPPIHG